MPEVIIRNERLGLEYGIQSDDFRRGNHFRDPMTGEMVTYDHAGFRIVSLADGSPYSNDPIVGQSDP
jgi:hypothetical protein